MLVAATIVAASLAGGSCGLNGVDVPDHSGAGSFAESLRLTATPDALPADGRSTSLIRAALLDRTGKPIPNRDITFAVSDPSGNFGSIGTLNDDPVAATARTDGSGVASVIYRAPVRSDNTANRRIQVGARAIGTDANGSFYSTVTIDLRSVEPIPFPPRTNNALPTCEFVLEPSADIFPLNFAIGFFSAAGDSDGVVVRYEWFFGDGDYDNKPQTNHIYRSPGGYTVTHVATDNNGGQCRLSRGIGIQ